MCLWCCAVAIGQSMNIPFLGPLHMVSQGCVQVVGQAIFFHEAWGPHEAHVVIGKIPFLVFLEPRSLISHWTLARDCSRVLKIFCNSLPWSSSSECGSLICEGQQEILLLLSDKVDCYIMSHNLGVTMLSPLTHSISTSIQKERITQRCG